MLGGGLSFSLYVEEGEGNRRETWREEGEERSWGKIEK
jgi:hypothetical protein